MEKAPTGVDPTSETDGSKEQKDRITYTSTTVVPELDENGQPKVDANGQPITKTETTKEHVATLNDGLRFTGNNTDSVNTNKLNTLVTIEGDGVTKEASKTFESAAGNINVKANAGKDNDSKLTIQLSKTLKDLTSAEFKGADGNTTNITGDSITLKDKDGNTNTTTPTSTEVKDKDGNTNTTTATSTELKDKAGNTNTTTAGGNTVKDTDGNTTVVGPKEVSLKDKDGNNSTSITNNNVMINTKAPNTGVEKTSQFGGDKLTFTTTDEKEVVKDPTTGQPVIDPATGQPKEVVKNPGHTTEYTGEGLVVKPNTALERDENGNPILRDKDGNITTDPTKGTTTVADPTKIISFGMDKPIYDANGNQVGVTQGISAGMQQIHNVAPGTADTDAVNVSQLKGVSNQVINIGGRLNRLGAQSAALAGLQSMQYDPLEPTQVTAGLGYYKGETALALGINHYKNESTLFHAGFSVTDHSSELMANTSVTWKFGSRADETAVKDTFRQGPISASYTLQDKVSATEAIQVAQKERIIALEEEVKALKEQLTEVLQRISK